MILLTATPYHFEMHCCCCCYIRKPNKRAIHANWWLPKVCIYFVSLEGRFLRAVSDPGKDMSIQFYVQGQGQSALWRDVPASFNLNADTKLRDGPEHIALP